MSVLTLLGGLTVGPITIPFAWIGLLVGMVVGSQGMKWHIRRQAIEQGQPIGDLLFAIVIAWLIGWKFSELVIDPLDVLRTPLSLLTIPGDPNAGTVGTMVALLYGGYKYWRLKPQWRSVIDVWSVGLVAGGAAAELFWLTLGRPTLLPWGVHAYGGIFQPVNYYESIALWLSLAVVWGLRVESKGGWLLFLSGIGSLVVSLTAAYPTVVGGLSPAQWGILVVIVIGLSSIREGDRRRQS